MPVFQDWKLLAFRLKKGFKKASYAKTYPTDQTAGKQELPQKGRLAVWR
jgi:hypothetical protein